MSNRKAAFSAESYTLSGTPHVRCFAGARCVRLRAIRYDKDILNTIPYYDKAYNQIADVVSAAFSNKAVSWLDIGCGTGKMAKVAFEQCNVAKMICTDNSSAMLEAARQKISFSGVEFLKLPICRLEF
ncbi:class I SAM-dependent methyltransferase [Frisingicoccus sp.]|uniref:class I SAM-dependent methyltransferase n=1 Tax=Frisingicoccus sp. TaxID=1918627 RepID=UPI003AB829BB